MSWTAWRLVHLAEWYRCPECGPVERARVELRCRQHAAYLIGRFC